MAKPKRIHPTVRDLMRTRGLSHADARREAIWAQAEAMCKPGCFTPIWRWYYVDNG